LLPFTKFPFRLPHHPPSRCEVLFREGRHPVFFFTPFRSTALVLLALTQRKCYRRFLLPPTPTLPREMCFLIPHSAVLYSLFPAFFLKLSSIWLRHDVSPLFFRTKDHGRSDRRALPLLCIEVFFACSTFLYDWFPPPETLNSVSVRSKLVKEEAEDARFFF